MAVDELLERIRAFQADELARYRARRGAFAWEERYELMGRTVVREFTRDGEVVDLHTNVSAGDFHQWAWETYGRTPWTVWLAVPADGPPAPPRFEWERPPAAARLRDPALYVQELEMRPRPPELVPGWMKVELAALGAWDLRSDRPTWADHEPTGEPQTPESVGVEPPPGAEWALRR